MNLVQASIISKMETLKEFVSGFNSVDDMIAYVHSGRMNDGMDQSRISSRFSLLSVSLTLFL